jgi:DNA polymerase-3 subunit delta
VAKRTSPAKTPTPTTHPVCVVFGEDAFLVAKEAEKRLDALLDEEERMTGLSEPKASDARLADVLDELRTVPFLAARRVVLIKDAEPFLKNFSPQLEAYLDSPSPSGVLLMTATAFDKRTRFYKTLQKIGGAVEVARSSRITAQYTPSTPKRTRHALEGRRGKLLVELTATIRGGRALRWTSWPLPLYVSQKNQ